MTNGGNAQKILISQVLRIWLQLRGCLVFKNNRIFETFAMSPSE